MRRFAGYCAPDKAPYDYWLNRFEEGITIESCDAFFATLRAHIVPLLKQVQEKKQLSDACIYGSFPAQKQEELSQLVMDIMGVDKSHCGLGETEHPYTTTLGSLYDVRITTHYYEDNVASSLFSVIHEGGHALYELGIDPEMAYTVLDDGASMGIHESQSRFYENILGRSLPFIEYLFPQIQAFFPEQWKDCDAETFYRAVNRAQPSLIRTEADELTYCLHIMVRYELEKAVMGGELFVHELPQAWNRLYKEYLGIDVPDDTRGVLQDTHWSGGSIGYFPSYALGSAYSAQFVRKMKETIDVEDCLRHGNFAPINDWCREHVWKYGSELTPAQIFEKAAGAPFDPEIYTAYLEEKFKKLYQL